MGEGFLFSRLLQDFAALPKNIRENNKHETPPRRRLFASYRQILQQIPCHFGGFVKLTD
jgi:hypothetical protein